MTSRLSGRAVCIPQANVDTDVLYPGPYLNVLEPEEMRRYLFEGLDPSLRDQLDGETVLMVGPNFGTGSSREHVPIAMHASGVRCVVGVSFARIFQRNCINLGLPVIRCPQAVACARPGSAVEVDVQGGEIRVDGRSVPATPLAPFVIEMIAVGGLVEWTARRAGRSQRA